MRNYDCDEKEDKLYDYLVLKPVCYISESLCYILFIRCNIA